MSKQSKKKKSPAKNILTVIGRVLLVILMTVVFVLLALVSVIYILEKGPSETAKTLFVSSVKETSAIGGLATWFLSDEEVDAIMNKTSMAVVEDGTVTDTTQITIPENPSQEIELIEITGSTFKGKLLIVHDPSRVFLGTVPTFGETQGMTVTDMANYYDGLGYNIVAGVNGGEFYDIGSMSYTALPIGGVIAQGETKYGDYGETYHLSGFTEDNIFVMGNITLEEAEEMGIRDCCNTLQTTGPFLLMDGEVMTSDMPDSATYGGGKNPRTAIGQRADGAVLLLVVDGRQAGSLGATFKDLAYVMKDYGAINACAMDGGTSTQMYYQGSIINNPYSPTGPRKCPTAWLVQ